MGRTGLAQDVRFQRHLTGEHPERPERVERIAEILKNRALDQACTAIEIVPAQSEAVRRVHSDEYVSRLKQACSQGQSFIDVPDSVICQDSYEIARLAAGTVVQAVDEVLAGRVDHAFCAVRPPGHHAEHNLSMGFCLLNNIAIAALHLIFEYGLSRVLILDWDVHHCNGTQHTFESDPRVLVISLHGHPGVVYPGTGYEYERGNGEGIGYTINVPMLPGSGDTEYREAFDQRILPAMDSFKPQFVLVSAGFDAHRMDPLAPLKLETESFGWMTDLVLDVAAQHCEGRLVSLLEGGYNLEALGESVALHLERLIDR